MLPPTSRRDIGFGPYIVRVGGIIQKRYTSHAAALAHLELAAQQGIRAEYEKEETPEAKAHKREQQGKRKKW